MTGRRASAGMLAALVAAGSLTLALGFQVKHRCLRHEWDGYQYRTSCYNDIFALYFFRGFNEAVFPYFNGDGILENEVDAKGGRTEIGDLEYPALTGYYIGTIAEVTDTPESFFDVNAAGLALFGVAALLFIALMAADGRRVWYMALAPAVTLYAFHNWDLLAVGLMCGGLFAFHRRRDGTAGFLIGAGAAAKVFPALILPALMLARRRENDRRGAARMFLVATATFVVVNLPPMLANPRGWWLPWKFQSTRFPNFETWGYMVFRHLQRNFGNFWSAHWPGLTSALAALGFAGVAILLVRAELRSGAARPYALAFQLLLAFLLTGKIYSPQYALWVLPFFALVRMPWYSFAAFTITDAAVWASISSYFLATTGAGDPDLRLLVLEIAVWARYAVLVWLIYLARTRSEDVYERPPRPGVESPAPAFAA